MQNNLGKYCTYCNRFPRPLTDHDKISPFIIAGYHVYAELMNIQINLSSNMNYKTPGQQGKQKAIFIQNVNRMVPDKPHFHGMPHHQILCYSLFHFVQFNP